MTCSTCFYATPKDHGNNMKVWHCDIKKRACNVIKDKNCPHYLESPKAYWQRQKENKSK